MISNTDYTKLKNFILVIPKNCLINLKLLILYFIVKSFSKYLIRDINR